MNLSKIKLKDILLVVLAGFIIFTQFFQSPDPVDPDPVIIVTPGVTGTVEEVLEDVKETEVEIPSESEPQIIEKIIVDEEYKNKYEKAIKEKDSLEAENLFLRSIQINEYNKVLVDDEDIKIVAYAKTRGKLLEYKADYIIKADTITYIPEVIKERPGFTMLVGLETIIPLQTNTPGLDNKFAVKGDIGFQNKKGNIISLGADTQKNVYLGYKHAISLRKKRN